ncbi:MAG: hypothetical protein ABI649_00565 [Gaiellaceae bacterium]
MASKKVQAALLKQKEAKQKKILFLLIPLFIGLLAWQGPKTLKAFTGGSPPPPPPAAAPATTTAPTPGSAPSTPGAGAAGTPGVLVDTDAAVETLDGQMSSFSVFPGRDPFAGGPKPTPPASTEGSTTGTAATPTTAQLEINGGQETVAIAGTFPKSDPVFKLVSLTAQSALISLVSGDKFTNGNDAEAIEIGKTLTVTGDDGSSFQIKLVSIGSG